MSESGYPNFVMSAWFALYAPAGTPRRIVDVLYNAMAKSLADPDISQKLLATGTEPYPAAPDELGQFTRTELERYRKVVELTGAKAE